MVRDEVYRIVAVTTALVGKWNTKIEERNAAGWFLIFRIEIVDCVMCGIEQRFGFRFY